MSDTSVVNLGELTKPATVLIEKISEAVGGIFKPYQIVRVASAQAEADRIRAQTGVEIAGIERRAFNRFLQEEAQKQANIEAVIRLTIPRLDAGATPEAIENDWIANFFDKCRLTSDSDLRELWSRILAGQANSPGRFGKRTVNFLQTVSKSEAEQFMALCSFCWSLLGNSSGDLVPFIFDFDELVETNGIDFNTVTHLESIGLARYDAFGVSELDLPKRVVVSYFGRKVVLTLPKTRNNRIKLGKVLLTRMGLELAPISGAEPNEAFFQYSLDKWQRLRYSPTITATA